jgi:hypothetical protein
MSPPLTEDEMLHLRWISDLGVEGSVAGEELRQAVREIDRLREVIRQVIEDTDEYGMEEDDPVVIFLREEGLGEKTGV